MVTLLLNGTGIAFSPPSPASFLGLLLAYVYTNVPLFVLLTVPAMNVIRGEWMEAAEICGATRRQFWRMVGIPVLTPFLAAGWLLIFTWSIGIYGSGLRPGRQRRQQPAATDDLTDRSSSQLGRQ